MRILLASRPLSRLVAAFSCVTVAEWGYVTALSVFAFRTSGAIAVGLVGLRLFLAAASSLVGAAVLHRRSTGWTLSVIAASRTAIVGASAALAFAGGPLALLLVLLGVDSVISAQYRPAQSALIPSLARNPTELVASASGVSTVKTLSQAVGSASGGFLIAVVSPAAVFAGAAGLFAVASLISLSFVRRRSGGRDRLRVPFGDGIRGAFQVVQNRTVAGILIVSGLRTFVRGMWIAIAVIASLKLLHAGSTGVGLLMLAAGVGSLVAAPLSSMVVTRPRLGTPAAMALMAAFSVRCWLRRSASGVPYSSPRSRYPWWWPRAGTPSTGSTPPPAKGPHFSRCSTAFPVWNHSTWRRSIR